jgi:hypothetical protein
MANEAPKFEIPEIADLDRDNLLEARVRARSEIDRLSALADDEIDAEALEAVLDHVQAIDARVGEIDTEATERAERLAAVRERAAATADAPVEPSAEVVEPAAEPAAEVVAEVEPEPVGEPALVASGAKRPTARAASAVAPTVIIKKEPEVAASRVNTITAAANVPDFDSGTALDGMDDVAKAFLARIQGLGNGGAGQASLKPGVYNLSPRAQRFGVARVRSEGTINLDEMTVEQQFAAIEEASKDPGAAILAAGGWCAPSETIYDLPGYETAAGLISVPEVTARRGGISFTKGPDFMTIFGDADAGFTMTETQAESGSFVKPCYALECPPFEEVRLDAVGFCATAPLLTEAAYPELVRRVLNLLVLGHQRRKSASTISRIAALITNTVDWVEIGAQNSGIADALSAAELNANRIRQALAMDPNATIEGIAPYWMRGAFRNDLSRRLGLTDPFNVSDSDIDSWFALRGISFQYVYDYQMLGTGALNTAGGTLNWTGWPSQVEFMMYPAGAYTRLVHDVINIDAVYDHDLLTQNEYTAAFVEEGMAVANTKGFGVKITVGLNYLGAAGFPSIGAGEGVTFAAA